MFRRIIPALLLASLAACGGITDPSKNKTETFTGVVQVGGSGPLHPFDVSKGGEISITVTAFTPQLSAGTLFGVVWGQNIGGQCSLINFNQFAVVGSTAISSAISPGSYCVQVRDDGLFKVDETYTMQVSHP